MGVQPKHTFHDPEAKKAYTRQLIDDIKALEMMMNQGLIESGIQRIGAEQEICLVNSEFKPAAINTALLEKINDEHYVPEIAQFNVEINLDPEEFHSDCFSKCEQSLVELLEKGKKEAEAMDTCMVLTGILPTLRKENLYFDSMTPNPRYEALNDVIKKQRGSEFELRINGIDEFITSHPNILFEACNTSFQVHLQIEPDEFTQQYNWSQAIAGPVLAAVANSPLLMGKRLWSETRIALFQQSVDTRSSGRIRREKEPRVTFGKDWLRGTVVDLFKENVSRFNLLFATMDVDPSTEKLKNGEIPELKALKLHNSTVYKWNRACYGVGGGKPHLRIENRYIPSGPTVQDEIANAAFWLGLMVAMPEEYRNLPELMSFDDVRYNFYNASRLCLQTNFKWFGQNIKAVDLLTDQLIPLARKGLTMKGVNQKDIDRYIGIIEERVKSGKNGSSWMLHNYSELMIGSTQNEASKNITKLLIRHQDSGLPVHEWPDVSADDREKEKEFRYVSQIMSTDLFTVHEDDLVDLVVNMMNWQKVQYIPVENDEDELVGLITTTSLLTHFSNDQNGDLHSAKDIMTTEFPVISAGSKTNEAIDLLIASGTHCLPVMEDDKLVGILTTGDIVKAAKFTGKFND